LSNSTLDWLKAAFALQSIKGSEVNFHCPYCGHPRFYFNWRKGIGFCHRASCGMKPSLADLVTLKGYGPDDYYSTPAPEENKVELPKIELPEGCWAITSNSDPWAVKALQSRGLTLQKIVDNRIHAFANRIYIPIYDNGKLVQYIGRAIDRSRPPEQGFKTDHLQRFKYAKGRSITEFIFDWDNFKGLEDIVLVESTFNAMAWGDKFNCTTNFGSHLSKIQVDLLAHSNVKRIVLAWDKDALHKAYKVASTLKGVGINTALISYFTVNQPDDLPIAQLTQIIEMAFDKLQNAPQFYGPLRLGV
jgi:hypothetical protein